MAAPDKNEVEELVHVSVKSVFKWVLKVAILSVPAYLLIHFLVGIETLAQGAFVLGLLVPFYFHSHNPPIRIINAQTNQGNYVEYDAFGD